MFSGLATQPPSPSHLPPQYLLRKVETVQLERLRALSQTQVVAAPTSGHGATAEVDRKRSSRSLQQSRQTLKLTARVSVVLIFFSKKNPLC